MKGTKRFFSLAMACLLTIFTLTCYLPAQNAVAKASVPQVAFADAPVTQYTAGDRVSFNIHAPNYGGRVQYRVVLWNDQEKTYYDLWNAGNGYPNRYYTKWQPYGNNIFTLGWIIFEPGSYRITVYAKRTGIANNKTALKGYNCDSFMESIPFYVTSKEADIESILPLDDVSVMQGAVPTLPTKVRAATGDNIIKELAVTWPTVDTSSPGIKTIEGTVEGTTKKATIRINVTGQTAINVYSIASASSYLVNVTLKDAISSTPETSKFSIKSFSNSVAVPIQSASLSSDKKTVSLATGYMTPNSWYTLTVNNNSYNFIASQSTASGISLTAQNKEVAVGGTVYASVAKYPSDTTLTYYSSNPSIATIDQTTGLITGKYPGMATITVYGYKYGYSQVTTTFTVIVGQSGTYVYAANMEIGAGVQQMPNIFKNPNDLTLYFTSNNTSVASVNYYTGLVTGISPGTATITIAAGKSGINTFYSTFTVTVKGQSMSLTASPTWLSEAMANDGSLKSGAIDLLLTGSTFRNSGNYNYYEYYISIPNLPYGMSYTATYLGNNYLRVTLTGKAYANRNINDQTIKIVVSKEIINGASIDLSSNDIFLDFTDLPIPDAPTNPIVDDSNNTFGWTNVPGFASITDYEYRVKNGSTWSSWTECIANPQPVGNNSYDRAGVEVRVKGSAARNPGSSLASNAAFTAVANNPPAPTNPVVDDIYNTFGWTNISGFSNISDYEYSVSNGETWTSCTANPQGFSNTDYAAGAVQVRVKAQASPARPAGLALVSDKPFTKDTPIDDKDPVLGNAIMTFENLDDATLSFTNGSASVTIPYETVLDSMTIEVTDENLDKSDVLVYQMNSSGGITGTWGTLRYDETSKLWELSSSGSSQLVFDEEGAVKLSMTFRDTQDNSTHAYININIFMPIKSIADIEKKINKGGSFTLSEEITAVMKDDSTRDVEVNWGLWNPNSPDTSVEGVYTIKGTISGYTGEITLTLTIEDIPM